MAAKTALGESASPELCADWDRTEGAVVVVVVGGGWSEAQRERAAKMASTVGEGRRRVSSPRVT